MKDTDADFNIGFSLGYLFARPVTNNVVVAINGIAAPPEKLTRNTITGQFILKS